MKTYKPMVVALGLATGLTLGAVGAHAAVTAEEAAKLGDTLTPVGAIKAGNKEGTIPAWTGGLTKAPAGSAPKHGYVDPYADDKPTVRITAENMAQYADKLDQSQAELLKRNPGYYLDIYPTHRPMALPQAVYEATARNATACKILKDGLAVDPACRGGLPFPIPKSGFEVMWDFLLNYQPSIKLSDYGGWVVDTSGTPFMATAQNGYTERSYYLGNLRSDPQLFYFNYSNSTYPARSKGEIVGYSDFLDPLSYPRKAFHYDPGQRRVKAAPSFSYDTPIGNIGGVMLYDELFMFSGAMDRFDFKLVGKKEMYIPYDSYKQEWQCRGAKLLAAKTMNPACERWELHRVWVVEATLKSGMRHAYGKRTFYVDEDGYAAGMSDSFDHSGKLYRGEFLYPSQIYDVPFMYAGETAVYDFVKGNFTAQSVLNDNGWLDFHSKPLDERDMSPDALSGSGND